MSERVPQGIRRHDRQVVTEWQISELNRLGFKGPASCLMYWEAQAEIIRLCEEIGEEPFEEPNTRQTAPQPRGESFFNIGTETDIFGYPIPMATTEVPDAILRSSTYFLAAKTLYALLLSYAKETPNEWPSGATLRANMGVAEQTLVAAYTELQKAGLIEGLFTGKQSKLS